MKNQIAKGKKFYDNLQPEIQPEESNLGYATLHGANIIFASEADLKKVNDINLASDSCITIEGNSYLNNTGQDFILEIANGPLLDQITSKLPLDKNVFLGMVNSFTLWLIGGREQVDPFLSKMLEENPEKIKKADKIFGMLWVLECNVSNPIYDKLGFSINLPYTALCSVILMQDIEIVELMLRANPSLIGWKNEKGENIISALAPVCSKEIIELLNQLARTEADKEIKPVTEMTLKEAEKILQELHDANKLNPDKKNYMYKHALLCGILLTQKFETTAELFKNNPSLTDVVDNEGNTILSVAVKMGNNQIVKLLLETKLSLVEKIKAEVDAVLKSTREEGNPGLEKLFLDAQAKLANLSYQGETYEHKNPLSEANKEDTSSDEKNSQSSSDKVTIHIGSVADLTISQPVQEQEAGLVGNGSDLD